MIEEEFEQLEALMEADEAPTAESHPEKYRLGRIDFLAPDEMEQFLVHSRLEVLRVLRELATRNELITAYFDDGQGFFITTILRVDDEAKRLVLDYGPNEQQNQRALVSDNIIFVANHNKVRVQFRCASLQRVEFDDGPAFLAALPDQMIRVQRREYYRLTISPIHPLTCRFMLEDGTPSEVRIVDISGGGIGIMESEPEQKLSWEPGTVIHDCRITLPDQGSVTTDIEVRNRYEVERDTGEVMLRAGCRFLALDTADNANIQRYIHRVELERRRLLRA